jgi:non-heme Fe2+,alpha-ketoglutarate-dependent halogenase
MEAPITEEMIAPMPLKSGQAVIFTESCIHGSGPNASNDRRFGLAFRAIRPDCAVYRDEKIHYVNYLNEQFDLANWGCTLLRGEDKYRLNKLVPPPNGARADFEPASRVGAHSG